MATTTRKFKFTYNGFDSETNGTTINKFSLTESYTTISFACDFLIFGTSMDNLETLTQAMLVKMREWNGDLVITFDSTTYNLKHSTNTGFLGNPTVEKIQSEWSSALCRHFRWSIRFEREADQSGFGGRREGNISLSYNQNRRETWTFTGVYTATSSSTTAQTNYDHGTTGGKAWAISFLATPANYEIEAENQRNDQFGKKLLFFTLVYRESLHPMSFTYNTYTVPLANADETTKINWYTISESYDSTAYTVNFSFQSDTAGNLNTKAIAMEDLLQVEDKDLLVKFNSTDYRDLRPSQKTGFLTRPTITKDQMMSSGTERIYTFSCSVQMAGRKTGARRDHSSTFAYDPGRRIRATMTGTYTASSGKTAYANYTDGTNGGAAYSVTQLAVVGGAYELIDENFNFEQQNEIVRYTLMYQEIIQDEASAGTNNATIQASVLNYAMSWPNEFGQSLIGYSVPAAPPPTVRASYSCWLDNTLLATDNAAEVLYRGTIKPYLLSHLASVLNLSAHAEASDSLIALSEDFSWNPSESRMDGTLNVMAPQSTSAIISYQETVSQNQTSGKTWDPLWDGADHSYSTWGIGRRLVATVSTTITKLGSPPADPPALSSPWEEMDASRTDRVEILGSPSDTHSGGETQAVKRYTAVVNRTYIFSVAKRNTQITEGAVGGRQEVFKKGQGVFEVAIGGQGNTLFVIGKKRNG